MKRKIEITCRFSGRVLFSHEAENNTMRLTVEAAVKACADLSWADLTGADLTGADLARANLAWADLTGANLARANLTGADLTGANLAWADLDGAYLARANLAWADLDGAYLDGGEKLTGRRPILQVGPIGSASRYLIAFLTDQGLRLRTGCFFGTREQFEAKLADTHGDNEHAEEYRAALALIDVHERLWMPDDEASDAARTTGQEG